MRTEMVDLGVSRLLRQRLTNIVAGYKLTPSELPSASFRRTVGSCPITNLYRPIG